VLSSQFRKAGQRVTGCVRMKGWSVQRTANSSAVRSGRRVMAFRGGMLVVYGSSGV
jgi:hypothetical protein